MQHMRPLALAAGVILSVLPAAAGAASGGHSPAPARTVSASQPQYTANWAGYVREAASTREVSARWRVPRLGTSTPGSASTWVGIDGSRNAYLAQVGTAHRVTGRSVSSYAWWEVITPTSDTTMRRLALTVRPGDEVLARVSTTGRSVRLAITNLTTHRSAVARAPYRGPGTSAEWIQENVEVNGVFSAAPAWTPVTFTALTRNGTDPGLRVGESLDIRDDHGVRETSTSASTKGSFTVTRLAAGHAFRNR